jgi:hypothetical protein
MLLLLMKKIMNEANFEQFKQKKARFSVVDRKLI